MIIKANGKKNTFLLKGKLPMKKGTVFSKRTVPSFKKIKIRLKILPLQNAAIQYFIRFGKN